ncbi:hypothetical protein EpBp4_0056 [Escherichia phage Bp4]|uniref:Uncharacterized protein n=3 Tax=Gamaleyavirus TaxID=1920753 RepID=X2KQU2_9CAUD|nr:hypothetical protein ECBP1_0037 [Escherichia phage ECBP1]YP_009032018.1 hypothetical protein EpBp4_0056 [Escherichia phage Bp4]AXY81320.1 hypothetical protein [Escherichia phage PD38]UWJ04346.1 hypothetical protein [Escherichia phage vB_EcoS_Uz-1]AFR51988.1 hypothetical protein ECBP1_0037 [Escherichia phage ECBP1]AHN83404.1 hypothetical protein EpBp4_0056 [Escherichia phage Bp4]
MINPEVIHSKTGKAVPLSEIAVTGDIAACPANIASLCICIAALAEERKLWLEPSKEMIQAGLAEVQNTLDNWEENGPLPYGTVNDITDDMASDMAVFVLQAMAGKRNG